MIAILAAGEEAPAGVRLLDALLLSGGFHATTVVLGTTLLGIAAGVVGTFALLRRRALLADAAAHATLPGLAGAFLVMGWLGIEGRWSPGLLLGAGLAAALGVLAIRAIVRATRLGEDAAIGTVLSVFFGAGMVLLGVVARHPRGEAAGLEDSIFGAAATMLPGDVVLLAVVAGIAVLAAVLLLKELRLLCFDEEFGRVIGRPLGAVDAILLGLILLVVLAGLGSVGMLLVVGLLVIPPAAAGFWSDRIGRMVPIAALVGAASGWIGSAISASAPRLPTGPMIVLVAASILVASALLAPRRGVLATAATRLSLRRRIAVDHLVEALSERDDRGWPLASIARARGWGAATAALVLRAARVEGLVAGPSTALRPTPRGRARGLAVRRNHRLWKAYLVRFAEVAPSHVDLTAERVEHLLAPEIVRELERSLGEEVASDGERS